VGSVDAVVARTSKEKQIRSELMFTEVAAERRHDLDIREPGDRLEAALLVLDHGVVRIAKRDQDGDERAPLSRTAQLAPPAAFLTMQPGFEGWS
jgi:hypothetical protein